jgi:hypothetical protein
MTGCARSFFAWDSTKCPIRQFDTVNAAACYNPRSFKRSAFTGQVRPGLPHGHHGE